MIKGFGRLMPISAAFLTCMSGCGGGGGDGGADLEPTAPPPTNASPGGIWRGSLGSGQQIIGLLTETGEFHFLADDGVQYFGTVTTNVNAASANFTAYTALGTVFEDGSTRGTGSLSGTINARSTLSANTTFQTSGGASNTNTVSLTYSSLYDRDSSLATISGNFRDTVTNNVLNVNNGTAFLQDPSTGCVINGTVSIINASFNAYRVEFTYSNCSGQSTLLNGATFRGLATLDNSVTPEQMIVGAQAQVGATGISEIFVLDRT